MRLLLLFVLILSAACSTTKLNQKAEFTSMVKGPFLPFEKFQEQTSFTFLSNVSNDTTFKLTEGYSFKLNQEFKEISSLISFELVIRDYIENQFSQLNDHSELSIIVQLANLDIIYRRKLGTRFSFEVKSKFNYTIEISRNESLIYFETVEEYALSEVKKDNIEKAVINSLNSTSEAIVMKLYSIFRDCSNIVCVSKKSTNAVNESTDVKIISFSKPGNLKSYNPIEECVSINEVDNIHSPADLLPSAKKCIYDEKYQDAVQLSALARIYAFYDSKRVVDETAHQAIFMLEENTFIDLSIEQLEKLAIASNALKNQESELTLLTCKAILNLGAPSYHPTYMIQHGLGAFSNLNGTGILEGFDVQENWNDVLINFGCLKK